MYKFLRELIRFLLNVVKIFALFIFHPIRKGVKDFIKNLNISEYKSTFTIKEQMLISKATTYIKECKENCNNSEELEVCRLNDNIFIVSECILLSKEEYKILRNRKNINIPFSKFVTEKVDNLDLTGRGFAIAYFEFFYKVSKNLFTWLSKHCEIYYYNDLGKEFDSISLEGYIDEKLNLPESIHELTNLESIYLRSTSLAKIPKNIGKLYNLKSLSVEYSLLKAVPDEMRYLHNLLRLSLWGNALSCFPECVYEITSLEDLDLSGNNIESISNKIGDLTSLKRLNLEGSGIISLPNGLSKLIDLRNLVLNNNNIKNIPESITNLNNLKVLNLEDNPELILSKKQKDWIEKLKSNGCKIQL